LKTTDQIMSILCANSNNGKHRRGIYNTFQYTCTIPYKNLEKEVKENSSNSTSNSDLSWLFKLK